MNEADRRRAGEALCLAGAKGLRAWVADGVPAGSAGELVERAAAWLADPAARIVKNEADVTIAVHPDGVFVKRYRYGTLGRRARSLGRPSRGRASLRNTLGLAARGFRVPRPLFATEIRRAGMVRESVYACECLPDALDLVDGVTRAESRAGRRALLREAGRLLGALHAARVYHADLKGSNVLVAAHAPDAEVPVLVLTDTDRVVFDLDVSRGRRIENLEQILSSFDRIGKQRGVSRPSSRTDRLRLVRAYLSIREDGKRGIARRDVARLVLGRPG